MASLEKISRRALLQGAVSVAAGQLALATHVSAQSAPLRLGVLTPLTGAGGFDGPRMLKAMQAVAAEVNGAGGVIGRQIELVVEDDQTNPEAAVRAARKLIDVSKAPVSGVSTPSTSGDACARSTDGASAPAVATASPCNARRREIVRAMVSSSRVRAA